MTCWLTSCWRADHLAPGDRVLSASSGCYDSRERERVAARQHGWGDCHLRRMITFVWVAISCARQSNVFALLSRIDQRWLYYASAVAVVHTESPAGRLTGNAVYWIVIIASGVFATAYCNFLWNRSIQEIGAARTSIFINLMPLASLYTASLLFAEAVTPARWAGLGAVVLGVYLGTVPDRKPAPQGEQSAGSGLSSAYRA